MEINCVEKNILAKELEKTNLERAIELYEENISENFDGSFPYDRLIILYKKQNKINESIRVVQKAIYVFDNIVYKERVDRLDKLKKYKTLLKNLQTKNCKSSSQNHCNSYSQNHLDSEQILNVTVIDFETANHSFTSACSIGIAVIKGNEIVDRQYYLIQPPNNFYTNDNIAIHHITPADTNNAETFPAVWEKIKYLFENTYLAAHNAIFDMSVLKATLNYYNLPQPHFEYVNTIAVSSYAIPQGLNIHKSLDARCEYFGITLDNHHNALADAEAAAQLILCNLAHSKFKSAATFLRSNSSYLKNYDDVKIQEEAEFKRYNRVDVNEIAASTTVNEEKDADFNGKTFVITGEFKTMTREQALSTVVARGGIIKNSVSSKVDILVNADDRTSIKTEKAAELQAAGHHIKVINEEQFMRMLESNDAIDLEK